MWTLRVDEDILFLEALRKRYRVSTREVAVRVIDSQLDILRPVKEGSSSRLGPPERNERWQRILDSGSIK